MEGYSHPQRRGCRPGLIIESFVYGDGGLYGIGSNGEDGKAAIALAPRPDKDAVARGYGSLHESVVPDEGVVGFLRILLPERSASLYISKKEGNCAGW
jgi:hypothetical protein